MREILVTYCLTFLKGKTCPNDHAKCWKDFSFYDEKQLSYSTDAKNNISRADTVFYLFNTDCNLKQQTHGKIGENVSSETSVEEGTLVLWGVTLAISQCESKPDGVVQIPC